MTISVITPFYIGNKYIKRLTNIIDLNSKQLHMIFPDVSVEYIIVNDSPECEVRLEMDIQRDCIIKIINHKINYGIQKARITGLENSIGDFVTFLDQDDKLEDSYLLSQYMAIGEANMVIANGIQEYCDHNKIFYRNKLHFLCAQNLNCYLNIRNQIMSPGQCLIRRDSIPDEWLSHIIQVNGADDLFLWILMLSKNNKVAINQKILYTHVLTNSNLSDDLNKMDKSIEEVVTYLNSIEYVEKKTVIKLLRCKNYKKKFRSSKIFMKFIISIKNFDLAFGYFVFYLKALNVKYSVER